jgi:5-methylcytosine-specific restriction endonuclease McrA
MTGKRRLRHHADTLPPPAEQMAESGCPLCGRPLPNDASVDEHHLVPRSQGGRLAFRVHRICHMKIHSVLSEAELARSYDSWERLQAHSEIATFIAWVANKPPGWVDASRKPASRRR